MPAILFISLALAIIGVALLTYVSALRLSVIRGLDLRIARDAALSGFEYGRDKLETEGASYAGTTAPTNCSNVNPALAPYTVQATTFCATFRIEVLQAPASGASKQVRSTGIVYRLQGSTAVAAAQQVYVGNIAKIAYSPETQLSTFEPGLYGITNNLTGTMMFAEFGGNRVATLGTDGAISEFAIPLSSNNSGPTELTVAPDNRVWFTQYNQNKLSYTSATAGGITEYTIPTANSYPLSIALGPDNNIWYGGAASGKIGKFNRTTSAFTEYTLPSGTYGPTPFPVDLVAGPASDGGRIWFLERNTGKVSTITTSGVASTIPLSLPASVQLRGIAVGPDDNIWFTQEATNKVGKFALPSGVLTEYTLPTANSGPYQIARGNGNELWVTQSASNKVTKLVISGMNMSSTLTSMTEYDVSSVGGSAPRYIVKGNDNNMWFTQGAGGRIGKITSAGVLTGYGVSTSRQPQHIVGGPDGNMWFTEFNSGRIRRADLNGALTGEFMIAEGNSYPQEIIVGPDNNLWFTQSYRYITKLTTAGVMTSYPTITTTSHPVGLAIGPDNNLWFGDNNNSKIIRSTTAGAMTEYTIPTAGSAVRSLARAGNYLWFTERLTNKIGRIHYQTGVFNEYTIPTASSQPNFITTAANGDLWFTEFAGNKIGKITQSGVITEYAVPTANSGPGYIVPGPDGNIWFGEVTANKIGRITPGGIITEFPPTEPGSLIFGINFGPDGKLWYTNFQNNRIGTLVIQLPAVVYKEQTSLVAFRSDGEESQVL
ncbi:MAG TPA: hypothetical protein VFZ58_01250 [Candidatus Saccharimonadales bacterium]